MRKRPERLPAEARETTRLSEVALPPRHVPSHASGRTPDTSANCAIQTQGRPARRPSRYSPTARAVALLARREHSQAELVRKLVEREVPEEEARRVVTDLAALGLQSDERFLASRVRQRQNMRYGPKRAKVDLSRHGLDEEAVEREVDARSDVWRQGAYDLIERRFGPSPVPFEQHQRALGLLLRRGFAYDLAQEVVRQPRPLPEDAAGDGF